MSTKRTLNSTSVRPQVSGHPGRRPGRFEKWDLGTRAYAQRRNSILGDEVKFWKWPNKGNKGTYQDNSNLEITKIHDSPENDPKRTNMVSQVPTDCTNL